MNVVLDWKRWLTEGSIIPSPSNVDAFTTLVKYTFEGIFF